jgi:DNA-binding protein YbaB
MPGLDVGQFERMLDESRRMLDTMREGGSVEPDEEPPTGSAEAADGLVRATATGGRLHRLELDPRAMRLPSETLAEEITIAVNAALNDLRAASAQARGADLAVLSRQVREVQDEGVRRMAMISSAIQEAMARMHEGRR